VCVAVVCTAVAFTKKVDLLQCVLHKSCSVCCSGVHCCCIYEKGRFVAVCVAVHSPFADICIYINTPHIYARTYLSLLRADKYTYVYITYIYVRIHILISTADICIPLNTTNECVFV